jgi:hypothetical protein
MFYGMREVIVRDLNGFWITFGEELPADALTPWPPADSQRLQPYAGKYKSDGRVRGADHRSRGAPTAVS